MADTAGESDTTAANAAAMETSLRTEYIGPLGLDQ
jgi:hypothetical protein